MLLSAGFTVDTIVSEGPDAISRELAIEPYVAKIIYDEAKKITAENPPTLCFVLGVTTNTL